MTSHLRELIRALTTFAKLHEGFTRYSREVLDEYHFGYDVVLSHETLIEPCGESVKFSSIHRIAVSIGHDFEKSNEISISASVLIGSDTCTSSLRIRAVLDEAVGSLAEGIAELLDRGGEHPTLHEALDALESALDELRKSPQPFGPLASRP
ncbi:hypothetical protein [Streptomyces sp. NPDC000961]|uniref:hypothetical protein n=1 Tax=Streptomyces sp. NPDC000961 TaxID=3364541 RepID=UPI00368A3583